MPTRSLDPPPRGVVAFVALLSFTGGCGRPPAENRFVEPESRLLAKVHLWIGRPADAGRVVFWPTPHADWRALLKVDPCGPFHPGMTFVEAEERFGPADERGGNPHGAYVGYRRGGFRFLIGRYTFSTGGIPLLFSAEDASYEDWVLVAHPVARHVTDVFQPETAAYIDGNRDEFTIMGADHLAVHGHLHGLRVDYLYPTTWAGCRGASAERQPTPDNGARLENSRDSP